MHIERHFLKPSKTNNVFVLLWRWIREKYRQRFVYSKCLPSILLPNLRRVYPALEPKDPASEFKEKGNNPFPVDKEKGHVCCDSCAYKVVVPARMKMMMSRVASAAKNG